MVISCHRGYDYHQLHGFTWGKALYRVVASGQFSKWISCSESGSGVTGLNFFNTHCLKYLIHLFFWSINVKRIAFWQGNNRFFNGWYLPLMMPDLVFLTFTFLGFHGVNSVYCYIRKHCRKGFLYLQLVGLCLPESILIQFSWNPRFFPRWWVWWWYLWTMTISCLEPGLKQIWILHFKQYQTVACSTS